MGPAFGARGPLLECPPLKGVPCGKAPAAGTQQQAVPSWQSPFGGRAGPILPAVCCPLRSRFVVQGRFVGGSLAGAGGRGLQRAGQATSGRAGAAPRRGLQV